MDVDVAIVGGGVVGCAIARQLSRYRLDAVLIDAADDFALGATRANSAIVHAGYDCPPGSAEARLNVRGNELFEGWCEQLDVPFSRTGSLVIGFDETDAAEIEKLKKRGEENGVPGLEVISGERARQIEPALNPDVTLALHAPTAGITGPFQLAIACAENARDNGVKWLLGCPVTSIERGGDALLVAAGDRTVRARYLVNAAGLFSDDVARLLGDDSFEVRPRKGEYLMLDRAACIVRTVIFQTPSPLGKGVLVAPTVEGNMFAGPTAVDQDDKHDASVSAEGIETLRRLSRKSAPAIDLRAVITAFAGIRAQPSTGDFIIRPSGVDGRMIHAAGICSPGLTSAPAIAEEVVKLLGEAGLALREKPDYRPRRAAIPHFLDLSMDERRALIEKDPRYGRVVCRCETVTEAEIVQAIERGARSLDGVKRRTRAGTGRCQGGFCAPRVMEILSRELGVPMEDLTKFGGRSYLLARPQGGERHG
ncbi:MAG: NAD(P)/FAD-dependent oxidoreductase [Clostridiales bacterium]|nr:NAD(P)/FAD-dependent oxidoreductase [Clostridiales bacterium]